MQLLAENIYASTFAFRGNENGTTVKDMFPLLFQDDDDEDIEPPISEQAQQELLDLINDMNAKNNKSSE